MKKILLAAVSAAILTACGDTIENQMGMDVVDSVADLPKCTSSNEGEQALVKGETSVRVCVDGEWFATASGEAADFSCKTEELKDGSGLKIVCNGDSIGVVLNGEKGDAGKDGKNGEDGKDAVVANDTLENDSERVSISLDSLAGYSQKGPFLKGSTVYLYELSDGRTLKQTNGNFTSIITRDDGRYKFTARDLVSQYAMIVVDGNYRNEVTGGSSNDALRLRAISDMRKHSDANINLLTHLEFDRVYYLVTRGDSTGKKLSVKNAKRQAQRELLKQFYIELDSSADAEDLNVFGQSDADAALLAISVLLQANRKVSDLSILLTEISNDMETDGEWGDSATRTQIADWAFATDLEGKLDKIRDNVTNWGLGTAPDFKNIVRRFYSKELHLGVCDGKDVAKGTVKHINKIGSEYYTSAYDDTSGTYDTRPYKKTRFICEDESALKWRVATNWEMDLFDWHPVNNRDGALIPAQVTDTLFVWEADTLRYADSLEIYLNRACVEYIKDMNDTLGLHSSYTCKSHKWSFDSVNVITDSRDGRTYKTIKIGDQYWMAENLNFEYKVDGSAYGNKCALEENEWMKGNFDGSLPNSEDCSRLGRFYTWAAAMDSAAIYSTDGRDCGYGNVCARRTPIRGACPEGWHLPDSTEWKKLYAAVGESPQAMQIRGSDEWTDATDAFGFAVKASVYNTDSTKIDSVHTYYTSSFWGSTETGLYRNCNRKNECADYWLMGNAYANLSEFYGYKNDFMSVRCVKDE